GTVYVEAVEEALVSSPGASLLFVPTAPREEEPIKTRTLQTPQRVRHPQKRQASCQFAKKPRTGHELHRAEKAERPLQKAKATRQPSGFPATRASGSRLPRRAGAGRASPAPTKLNSNSRSLTSIPQRRRAGFEM